MRLGDGDAYTAILMAMADCPDWVEAVRIWSRPHKGAYQVAVMRGIDLHETEIPASLSPPEVEYRWKWV